ncbi:ferritin-like domain-containing protein [Ilyomonas limi]|uniref:ferritin-like domain-containing protein n=1 Tax=Ilyomonas limi TaxID=2575867 RepID=UPI00197D7748|nr:ferritin-like domain-containing protein [Ilyomonas limi]
MTYSFSRHFYHTSNHQSIPSTMNTSYKWVLHFTQNSTKQRINWSTAPCITAAEKKAILHSLQAWQLGETSDGSQLLCAATKYATAIGEPSYIDAIALFIKEEQKHGNNLGKYLDIIGEQRIARNWGDTLFRTIRHINLSMEWWTLAVITVESVAQVFYQCLKDAANCPLLRQVCTDILIDEAFHIDFQVERMNIIYNSKSIGMKWLRRQFYKLFYFATIFIVWMAHKKVFKAGGNNFNQYLRKMKLKYKKTLGKLGMKPVINTAKPAGIKRIGNLSTYLKSVMN